jgi:sucrose-6-phosphate hydrolase SacC (GH32 family)
VVRQVTRGNRDPKVFWHGPTRKWVMALYVERGRRHTVHLLTSPDLKIWAPSGVVEGGTAGKDGYLFECPDLFELPVDGDPKTGKWVLLGANSEYAVGTFDGTAFSPEHSRLPGHRGAGFYAPQTFADVPAGDGRRVQIGWFQTPTPGMPFNQSMTVPHELRLLTTADGPRLARVPVKELEGLRAKVHEAGPLMLAAGAANPLAGVAAELLEVRAEFEPGSAGEVTFAVRGATVTYDARKQELVVNRRRAPAPLRDGKQRLTVLVDRTGLEVFAADGLTYVPMPFTPRADDHGVAVRVTGGEVRFTALAAYELRSAWRAR